MYTIKDSDIDIIQEELSICFDAPRRAVIKSYGDVQACPGSGKTTMVAAKLLILSKMWGNKYQGVCVLTHTNVAKNEIVDRLKSSKKGANLLQFPHFIGTIQEFVNKFLAIPYLRSCQYHIKHIDDELVSSKAWRKVPPRLKDLLARRGVTSLEQLKYKLVAGELKINLPGNLKDPASDTAKKLIKIKKSLIAEGYFFYDEMYEFARYYAIKSSAILEAIKRRFPVVFIDEMQDTQKHQDELLNDVFKSQDVCYQRFGDPDQAIYSGSADENKTYNSQVLDKIESSHRFSPSIANLAKRMSINKVEIQSTQSADTESANTIFLVDDETRRTVLDRFGELCDRNIPRSCTHPIKAIGATGEHGNGGLSLSSYCSVFSKKKAKNHYKPAKLIQYFYRAKESGEFCKAYQLILEGLIRCTFFTDSKLTIAGEPDKLFTAYNLKKLLKESGSSTEFNSIVLKILNEGLIEFDWVELISKLLGLIQIDDLTGSGISEYLEFQEIIMSSGDESSVLISDDNKINVIIEDRTFDIEIETIHSVKGETHAATLVLETKFHKNDVGHMVDYIIGENDSFPSQLRKQKFMKQLYVAFSRPKYLLCIAMDKASFPVEHQGKPEYGGWKIVDLTGSGQK